MNPNDLDELFYRYAGCPYCGGPPRGFQILTGGFCSFEMVSGEQGCLDCGPSVELQGEVH